MKGIIFNTVEETVTDLFGADMWDDLIDSAGVSGSYTALGTYPDEELGKIVMAACKATELPADEVLETLGRHSFAKLASHVPDLIDLDAGVFHFLSTVDDIIHVEVAKLVPGAETPVVTTAEAGDGNLEVTYTSKRQMGSLAKGLVLGAGDHFKEPLEVVSEQTDGNTSVFVVAKTP